MRDKRLIEIINSNQGLLQDLLDSEFLQNELVGMLRNIESNIPEDCRENFYTNLKTLRLDLKDENLLEESIAGGYSENKNKIFIDNRLISLAGRDWMTGDSADGFYNDYNLSTMYHETLHMASTSRDNYGSVGGFQTIEKDEDGEMLWAYEWTGLTEGFTEYLTMKSFNKDTTNSSYGQQIDQVGRLVEIVGIEEMKKAYFNNENGMEGIEKVLKSIDGKESHIDLFDDIATCFYEETDEYEKKIVAERIDMKLSELLRKKEMIKKENDPEPQIKDEGMER